MKKLICALLGHKVSIHLGYIWGNLAREHHQCSRCAKTLLFTRPTRAREDHLYALGDVRDCTNQGCIPFN